MPAWLAIVVALIPYVCLTHRKGDLAGTVFNGIVYAVLAAIMFFDRAPASWPMFGVMVLVSVLAGWILRRIWRRRAMAAN